MPGPKIRVALLEKTLPRHDWRAGKLQAESGGSALSRTSVFGTGIAPQRFSQVVSSRNACRATTLMRFSRDERATAWQATTAKRQGA